MGAVTHIIKPRAKDIGAFDVRRALPYMKQRSVGPWVFFDHFGPVDLPPGKGINVRPHPHINLATVTYLFEGEIFHRDSLGTAMAISPGAVNLMVAGKGISHSERTREDLLRTGQRLHGLQLWMALPEEHEEVDPAFHHIPSADIPAAAVNGVDIRVMMGEAYGVQSPVPTFSRTLYCEAGLPAGAKLALPAEDEIAVYVVEGRCVIDGQTLGEFTMAVIDGQAEVSTDVGTRIAVIGGAPLGKRHLWWNFVSSRKERIEQAKADWAAGRFGTVPGDADEFIPLPEGE